MPVDVVIPLRDKPSVYDDEELRYSLRSIDKHMDVRDVWVVGQPRGWLSVNWIPATDAGSTRYNSAYRKIMKACYNPYVSDPFVLFNDDFFLLKRLNEIPDYYDGTLKDRIKTTGGEYFKMLKKSLDYSDGKNYAVHTPVVIHKELFKRIPEGVSYRVVYGSMSDNKKEQLTDPKIYDKEHHMEFRKWVRDKWMFSASEFSFAFLMKEMGRLYPEKSRWE